MERKLTLGNETEINIWNGKKIKLEMERKSNLERKFLFKNRMDVLTLLLTSQRFIRTPLN